MEQITLKAARITAGFTLREVGKKLNRSFQTIAKYEKDSTKIPIDLLQDLTTLYNVSMDIIFLGRSTKKSVQKRKEQPNRNTILHIQISHVVLYHWGLTTKKGEKK